MSSRIVRFKRIDPPNCCETDIQFRFKTDHMWPGCRHPSRNMIAMKFEIKQWSKTFYVYCTTYKSVPDFNLDDYSLVAVSAADHELHWTLKKKNETALTKHTS